MNKFKVDNVTFEVDQKISKSFKIKSNPSDYLIHFKNFNNKFKNEDVILIDGNVKNLYNINHDKIFVINPTEESKSIYTVLEISEYLSKINFDKGNNLIVIGGGILQDLGAFVSKIYKRGIRWSYYPTTLLSQCDSCIGGKTALNFKNYKNQLALFSAPSEVIIDVKFLDTLEDKHITSGYGEIVKLFLIGGEFYVKNINKFQIDELIFHSLMIKKSIIEFDEFENNVRKSLNLGHSFGHVIESMSNYRITHGEAVLIGIEIINKLYANNPEISKLIFSYTSLSIVNELNLELLVENLKTDKKVKNGKISFVLTKSPGETIFLEKKIDDNLLNKVNEVLSN